jgi:hypothetical protein
MTAPAPLGQNVINNHIAKRAPSRHDITTKTAAETAWISSLLSKKPVRLVSVALANKTARIAWALLSRGEVYRSTTPAGA